MEAVEVGFIILIVLVIASLFTPKEEKKTEETELLHERIDKLEVRQSGMLKRHGEDMKRVLTKINALEARQGKLTDLDIWYDRLRERVTTLEKGD